MSVSAVFAVFRIKGRVQACPCRRRKAGPRPLRAVHLIQTVRTHTHTHAHTYTYTLTQTHTHVRTAGCGATSIAYTWREDLLIQRSSLSPYPVSRATTDNYNKCNIDASTRETISVTSPPPLVKAIGVTFSNRLGGGGSGRKVLKVPSKS